MQYDCDAHCGEQGEAMNACAKVQRAVVIYDDMTNPCNVVQLDTNAAMTRAHQKPSSDSLRLKHPICE